MVHLLLNLMCQLLRKWAKLLASSEDIVPNHLCCVVVASDKFVGRSPNENSADLINENTDVLVNYFQRICWSWESFHVKFPVHFRFEWKLQTGCNGLHESGSWFGYFEKTSFWRSNILTGQLIKLPAIFFLHNLFILFWT